MSNKQTKKIMVAMSGGVDSSVVAKILKDQGHNVVGIFLKFWHEDHPAVAGQKSENKCCSLDSFLDAKRVCEQINIPLYTLNYEKIFKSEVVDYFLQTYQEGATPNPCLICNKKVKLGALIQYAKNLNFDFVATGHYARLESHLKDSGLGKNNLTKLITAKDIKKDQAYFLAGLNQNDLQHLLFPLGDYTKSEVRALAKQWHLKVAEKKESQEVCFISDSTENFLTRNLTLKNGLIKNTAGEILGKHQGLALYTLGQRHSLKIGGLGPYYVIKKDLAKNELIVSNIKNDPALFSKICFIKNINWLSGFELKLPLKCLARHRYQTKLEPCLVCLSSPRKRGSQPYPPEHNPKTPTNYTVTFKNPVRALTPGQFIVFYQPCGFFAKLKNKYAILGAGEITK